MSSTKYIEKEEKTKKKKLTTRSSLYYEGSTRVTDRTVVHIVALTALSILQKLQVHPLTISSAPDVLYRLKEQKILVYFLFFLRINFFRGSEGPRMRIKRNHEYIDIIFSCL